MLTKTKIALVAAVVLGTTSAALAESYDYNPRDRNGGPVMQHRTQWVSGYNSTIPTNAEKAQFERASRSFDGGF